MTQPGASCKKSLGCTMPSRIKPVDRPDLAATIGVRCNGIHAVPPLHDAHFFRKKSTKDGNCSPPNPRQLR